MMNRILLASVAMLWACGPEQLAIQSADYDQSDAELVTVQALQFGASVRVSGEGRSTKRFRVEVPDGTNTMLVTLNPSTDLKLLVAKGRHPTINNYDCLSTVGVCSVSDIARVVYIDVRSTDSFGPVVLQTSSKVRGSDVSKHTALGLPDEASVGRSDRWLIVKPQYVLSYDTRRKVPNYSAWLLSKTDLGSTDRTDAYRTDSAIPTDRQASLKDYDDSGFARGHLTPSADRTDSTTSNEATFLLTNMVPQTNESNNRTWKDFENYERSQAEVGNRLYIVAGPIFGASPKTIGNGVAVPVSMFKVAVIMRPGQTTVDSSTQVHAAIIPNTTTVSGPWTDYKVSVDTIEAKTGLDLLADLPVALQAQLEK